MSSCKHNKVWVTVVSEDRCLWCYQCGAIRINYDQWVKPTGANGENPALLAAVKEGEK